MTQAEWTAAWTAALRELELDLERAEELLTGEHALRADAPVAAWTPPTHLGPLPTSLAGRAQALLDRQLATAAALTRAVTASRQHLALANRLDNEPASRPLYLDRAV
jgi:hypothetical protein